MFSGPREREHSFKIMIFFVNKIFLKQSVYILFIRCKLYVAAVINLQFIVTMFITIMCICISPFCWKVYVFILLNIVHIEPRCPVQLCWCCSFANGSLVNIISRILTTHGWIWSNPVHHSDLWMSLFPLGVHSVLSRKLDILQPYHR